MNTQRCATMKNTSRRLGSTRRLHGQVNGVQGACSAYVCTKERRPLELVCLFDAACITKRNLKAYVHLYTSLRRPWNRLAQTSSWWLVWLLRPDLVVPHCLQLPLICLVVFLFEFGNGVVNVGAAVSSWNVPWRTTVDRSVCIVSFCHNDFQVSLLIILKLPKLFPQ